jgi:hypothetical protein
LDLFNVTLKRGHPFSQSYGVRLPSSLTRVISITLGLLSLPTRVGLRYGRSYFNGNEAFLDGLGSTESSQVSPQFSATFSYNIRGGFSCPGLTYSGGHTMSIRYAQPTLPCPPSYLNKSGTGIITRCPSPTPFGLGLGPTNPTRINLP